MLAGQSHSLNLGRLRLRCVSRTSPRWKQSGSVYILSDSRSWWGRCLLRPCMPGGGRRESWRTSRPSSSPGEGFRSKSWPRPPTAGRKAPRTVAPQRHCPS
jgi:hypothetical protein